MKRLLTPAVLVLLPLASLAVFAQRANSARVCIIGRDNASYTAVMAGLLNSSAQARSLRDFTVKYLNEDNSHTNSPLKFIAVALNSGNREEVAADLAQNGCEYLVTVVVSPPGSTSFSQTTGPGAGIDPAFPQPAPLSFSIMHRKSPHLWVSYPDGSYPQYKWSAKDIADQVYKTILKNPTP